jgi:hypothetical protein
VRLCARAATPRRHTAVHLQGGPCQLFRRRQALLLRPHPCDPAAKNFFVCNRTLPWWVVSCALLAQGLDSNATLGNVLSAFKFGFWDGAVLPIGLGISLVLVRWAGDLLRKGRWAAPILPLCVAWGVGLRPLRVV